MSILHLEHHRPSVQDATLFWKLKNKKKKKPPMVADAGFFFFYPDEISDPAIGQAFCHIYTLPAADSYYLA